MLYKYLISRKGFTMMEILIVLVIMGILSGVAIPMFGSLLSKQKVTECRSQSSVMQTAVKQAMIGMIDNGKAQKTIYFPNADEDSYTVYSGDGVEDTLDDAYVGKECFVFSYPEAIAGETQKYPYVSGMNVFTLGDLRGGYRGDPETDYKKFCEDPYFHFLKKEALADKDFYVYLHNEEIPVCPFADYEDNDPSNNYYYYVFYDGKVLCSCSKCNAID